MKSRNILWNRMIRKVARGTPMVLLRGKDLLVQDQGAMRMGTNALFDESAQGESVTFSAEHLESLLKASEAVVRLTDRDVTIRSRARIKTFKKYTFARNRTELKPFNCRDMIGENPITVSEEERTLLAGSEEAGIDGVAPYVKSTTGLYSGIYRVSGKLYFATGGYSSAYVKRVDAFPIVPMSLHDGILVSLLDECEEVVLFTHGDTVGCYGHSSEEDYEMVAPLEKPKIIPEQIITAYERSHEAETVATVGVVADEFGHAIRELVSDAKRADAEDVLHIRTEPGRLRMRMEGSGVKSEMIVESDVKDIFRMRVNDPVGKELHMVQRRALGKMWLKAITIPAKGGRTMDMIRIECSDMDYICTASGIEKITDMQAIEKKVSEDGTVRGTESDS